ncbi:MAG: hypothetical protein KDD34_07655 [Bdellovibrionales bacterium]|nr:hypothetical protein [Bdellovibrionales bacterium]
MTKIVSVVLILSLVLILLFKKTWPIHSPVFETKHLAFLQPDFEHGFVWPQRVRHGDALNIFLHLNRKNVLLEINQILGPETRKFLSQLDAPRIDENTLDKCTIETGCEWLSNLQFKIPTGWPNGIYEVSFQSGNTMRRMYFFIPPHPNQQGDALFLYDWSTLNGHNLFGGCNFYGDFHDGKMKQSAAEVSHLRYSLKRPMMPTSLEFNDSVILRENNVFDGLGWLPTISQFLKTDAIFNTSLAEMDEAILKKYKFVVIAGTQEYLSRDDFTLLQHYVESGGFLIIAGSEFGLNYINYNKNRDSIAFYKVVPHEKIKDPPVRVTSVANPLMYWGFSFNFGVGIFSSKIFDFQIINTKHPYFENINVQKTDSFRSLRGWSFGAVLTQNGNTFCLTHSEIPCNDVEVLGLVKTKYQIATEESHERLRFSDLLANEFEHQNPEREIFAPLMKVKKGKGHFLAIPGNLLEDPRSVDEIQFIKNVVNTTK